MFAYDFYEEEDSKCPKLLCGGYVVHTRSYENADADGNRGIWVDFYECKTCGWEPGYDTYLDIENAKVGHYYEFTDTDGTDYEGTLTKVEKDHLVFDLVDGSDVEKHVSEIDDIHDITKIKERK